MVAKSEVEAHETLLTLPRDANRSAHSTWSLDRTKSKEHCSRNVNRSTTEITPLPPSASISRKTRRQNTGEFASPSNDIAVAADAALPPLMERLPSCAWRGRRRTDDTETDDDDENGGDMGMAGGTATRVDGATTATDEGSGSGGIGGGGASSSGGGLHAAAATAIKSVSENGANGAVDDASGIVTAAEDGSAGNDGTDESRADSAAAESESGSTTDDAEASFDAIIDAYRALRSPLSF